MTSSNTKDAGNGKREPLILQEQGSFTVGGTTITNPGVFNPYKPTSEGETLHGDHAYIFYQIPVSARRLPLVFLMVTGSSRRHGRPPRTAAKGYQNIFLRRRFAVYLIDQPRRGNAGRSTIPATISATPDDRAWFDTFRIGVWPNYFPGVQFSRDAEALN